jgi:hypothetical protein
MNAINLALTVTSELDVIVENSINYYLRNETITVTPSYTLPSGDVASDYVLKYIVRSPAGVEVVNIETLLTAPLEFDINLLGTYQVYAMALQNTTGVVSTFEIDINCINFLTISYTECNTFEISNKGVTTSTITINEVANTATLGDALVDSVAILPGEGYTFTALNAGVFTVLVEYTPLGGSPAEEVYVINNLCSLNDCVSAYILDILCEDTRDCKECPSETELNQLLLLYYTLNMELNQEYGFTNFYTNLEQTDLDNFASIVTLIERITKFCNRRNCNSIEGSPSLYTWNNSGCTTCNQ